MQVLPAQGRDRPCLVNHPRSWGRTTSSKRFLHPFYLILLNPLRTGAAITAPPTLPVPRPAMPHRRAAPSLSPPGRLPTPAPSAFSLSASTALTQMCPLPAPLSLEFLFIMASSPDFPIFFFATTPDTHSLNIYRFILRKYSYSYSDQALRGQAIWLFYILNASAIFENIAS